MTVKQLFHNLVFGENNHYQNREKYLLDAPFGSLATIVSPDLTRVFGCDVAGKWDGVSDFATFKQRGGRYVFYKAVDGSLPATLASEICSAINSAGLLQAPYAWLYRNVNVSGVKQAQAMNDFVQKNPPSPKMRAILDVEWTSWNGATSNPTYSDVDVWVTEWLRLGNSAPWIYSAPGYLNGLGTISSALKAKLDGLFIAHWGVSIPTLPMGFTSWKFWQFTASGDAAYWCPNTVGTKELDMSYYYGTVEQFNAEFGVTPQPEEDYFVHYLSDGTTVKYVHE